MEEMGVLPVVQNYNTIIKAYSRADDHEAALRMLNKMEASNVQGDASVYGSVMNACARANQADLAEDVFNRMLAAGVEPTMVSISMLAKAFSRERNWQACEALKKEAEERGLKMNHHMLVAMLLAYAFAKPRQPLRAEALIKEAKAEGVEMTEAVITAMQKAVGTNNAKKLMSDDGI
jgi:pentatricopeptide repeat protein